MDALKEIVKEDGIYDIIAEYKYMFEFADKYNKVVHEMKNTTSSHLRYRVMRNGYYRYSRTAMPNDVLMIHNLKTDRVSRLFNYNSRTFGRKTIINIRLYCSVLPIYSNFR